MNDRKHLTSREVERLMEAIKGSRTEARDRCLVLLMYRHGLRLSEACSLKLEQVDIADQGADTRLIDSRLSRPPEHSTHRPLIPHGLRSFGDRDIS